ncbi:lysophospholipid acyltransferase family protein [Acidimangrovimonas sediminis]|uniref:lysophospholipid acyltransferase family protein n=1 Tax=Acidimangrovimonas sediminis TaxID=2056283 RepID=UPI000C806B0E|nr:lysophospholipid acyltransferase family protein [Acidimangrovimonas sediminis]
MPLPLQWILSLVFIVQMYAAMAILAIVYTPVVLFRREAAFWAVHAYTRWVRFSARVLVGLRSEVRGTAPRDEALIVSKHQSFFDIILLVDATPRPKFIMKKELLWAPILGWYALKIGCVPVDRGKRGMAIKGMMDGVKKGTVDAGQLIIYPQGTRVAPGAAKPYKVGAGLLYSQLGQTCVPAATNVGVFWPRHGILRRRGLAVVEFLDPIAPGKAVPAFMAELESVIEEASDRLMAEAGFDAPAARAQAVKA